MRRNECTCPSDGSRLCERCARLVNRAVGAPAIDPAPQTKKATERRATQPRLGQEKTRGCLEASRGQKHRLLAARVAGQEWRTRLAALAPIEALCGGCQQTTPHRCTYAGWRCGGCGQERLEKELRGEYNILEVK